MRKFVNIFLKKSCICHFAVILNIIFGEIAVLKYVRYVEQCKYKLRPTGVQTY